MDFRFEEATREAIKLRMALKAIAGGGKTYTALALMTWILGELGPDMTKRIAVIDTERGSSRRYAKGRPFYFSVLELKSFEPEIIVGALKAAAAGGFEGVILDSFSHEWAGTGGALEQSQKAQRGGGNSFAAWGKITERHNAVLDTMMDLPIHVIATMRTKVTYEQTEDEKGKKQVKKLGLQPVQRDGVEYEFDILGDLDTENVMLIEKSRCAEIMGKSFRQPGKDCARVIKTWLEDTDAAPVREPKKVEPARQAQPAVEEPDAATIAMVKVADLDSVDALLATIIDANPPEDVVADYQRAAARRIIELATTKEALERARALAKASGASEEWHAKTKVLYGTKSREIVANTATIPVN